MCCTYAVYCRPLLLHIPHSIHSVRYTYHPLSVQTRNKFFKNSHIQMHSDAALCISITHTSGRIIAFVVYLFYQIEMTLKRKDKHHLSLAINNVRLSKCKPNKYKHKFIPVPTLLLMYERKFYAYLSCRVYTCLI